MVALASQRDQWHERARRFARTSNLRMHTTSIIVGETYTLLRNRAGYALARQVAHGIAEESFARVHQVDAAFDREIWAVIDGLAGVPLRMCPKIIDAFPESNTGSDPEAVIIRQSLSYADASLVVLGRTLRIGQACSFDDDLRVAGLALLPDG